MLCVGIEESLVTVETFSGLSVLSSGGGWVKGDRWSAGWLLGEEEGKWDVIEAEGRIEVGGGV